MHYNIVRRGACLGEQALETAPENAGRGSSPAGVEQRDPLPRNGQIHRNAIGQPCDGPTDMTSAPWTWVPSTTAEKPGNERRRRRQRLMTSPTGASPQRPRSNPRPGSGPRPVIPATTPSSSFQKPRSNRGGPPGTASSSAGALVLSPLPIRPFDLGSKCPQTLVDPLVAPLDLAHVVDSAGPLGGERREEHRHARPDIGRLHDAAFERSGS
jgi:hypothetical protein